MPESKWTYGYKIWTNDKVQVIVVSSSVSFVRREMSKDVVAFADTIEELMCGHIRTNDLDEAAGCFEDGGLAANTLPEVKPVPMSGGHAPPMVDFLRIVKRIS